MGSFPRSPHGVFDEKWLRRAGDEIGKTIKVDNTTRAAIRGRFARVCVEIDMRKPLKATYRLKGKSWRLQYEGLQDLHFTCGKYGHREEGCPQRKRTETEETTHDDNRSNVSWPITERKDKLSSSFGAWMVAHRNRR